MTGNGIGSLHIGKGIITAFYSYKTQLFGNSVCITYAEFQRTTAAWYISSRCLTPVLSWFLQQDAPLRFRCGYQPWGQAVSGKGGRWVVAMIQRCDWYVPITSHVSVVPEIGACLHIWTFYPLNSSLERKSFGSTSPQRTGLHSLTKSLLHF